MKIKNKKISSNTEDYLEAIYILDKKNNEVRVTDVSKLLNVTKPSVHQAIHILVESGLITHQNYGGITLTEEGREKGKDIYYKHTLLTKFITDILGVDKNLAEEDACRLEHFISKETFSRIVSFIEFFESYPLEREPNWMKSFKHFVKTGKRPEECVEEIEKKKEG